MFEGFSDDSLRSFIQVERSFVNTEHYRPDHILKMVRELRRRKEAQDWFDRWC